MERRVSFENVKAKYTDKLNSITIEIKNIEDSLYDCCAEADILFPLVSKNEYFKNLYDLLCKEEKELDDKLAKLKDEKEYVQRIIDVADNKLETLNG